MAKRYKLDLTLIERTKLLEGVLCQSLTFTNTLYATEYAQLFMLSPTITGRENVRDYERAVYAEQFPKTNIITKENEPSPLKIPVFKNVEFLSFDTIGNNIADLWVQNSPHENVDYTSWSGKITSLEVIQGGKNTTYDYPQSNLTITLKNNAVLKFHLLANYTHNAAGSNITETHEIIITTQPLSVVENRYPLKPYSIADCISRCLELAHPLKLGELPKYKLQGVNYVLNANGTFTRSYEAGSQASKFDKIIAPNFTMTQCTLREQLKVIGGFIHCEPRLGYDPDGTGLDYEENAIIFEQYEKEQDTNLGERGYVYRGVSQSLNNYCTSVTTNIANLVNTINYADGVIKDPDASAFRTLRTDSVNVMLTESNAKIYTQFPVYDIIKVECTIFNTDGSDIGTYDITPYVFEQHEYNNLSSYEGTYPYAKGYAIYYTQGQKNLDGLFFKNESASNPVFVNYAIKNIIDAVTGDDFDSADEWQRLAFRVSYIPVYSTMFSHGKSLIQDGNNNFTIPYAQSENLVESSYYGEHLKGLANRMGNIEQVRTYILPDVSYLPKAGQTLDGFVIASVKHDLRHTHVKCTVALTKDFNRLSQYVGVNSTKRISEVSEREAYSRDILIKEYAVIGDNQVSNASITDNVEPFTEAIIGSGITRYAPITAVIAAGAKKRYFKTDNANAVDYENAVALPVVSSAFGNAMVFSWTYKDNYAAIESLQKLITVGTNNNEKAAYQVDLPYCDYYGRFYWYDFALVSEVNPITNQLDFANGTTAGTGVIKYPDSGQITAFARTSQYGGKHNPILVEKDSREALNVNYEIEFISNRADLILGSAVASKCSLVGAGDTYSTKIYFFKGVKFGKYPRSLKEIDMTKQVGVIERYFDDNLTVNTNSFEFDFSTIPEFDSWCIAYYLKTTDNEPYTDENGDTQYITTVTGGDITIACNNGSAYYASKYQTKEQIYITISDTNLKGV